MRGLVELAGHEGICLSKYKDSVGVWTIGIGATRTEIPDIYKWPLSKRITMEEAFKLFKKSIRRYENALNKHLTRKIKQTEYDALCSWCYNVGVGWVHRATVIRRINNGESGMRLYDALMMYRKPPEITGRRKKEAKLLAHGIYSNEGKALLFPVSSKGYPIYRLGKSINVWEYLGEKVSDSPEIPEVRESDEIYAHEPILSGINKIIRKIKDYLEL